MKKLLLSALIASAPIVSFNSSAATIDGFGFPYKPQFANSKPCKIFTDGVWAISVFADILPKQGVNPSERRPYDYVYKYDSIIMEGCRGGRTFQLSMGYPNDGSGQIIYGTWRTDRRHHTFINDLPKNEQDILTKVAADISSKIHSIPQYSDVLGRAAMLHQKYFDERGGFGELRTRIGFSTSFKSDIDDSWAAQARFGDHQTSTWIDEKIDGAKHLMHGYLQQNPNMNDLFGDMDYEIEVHGQKIKLATAKLKSRSFALKTPSQNNMCLTGTGGNNANVIVAQCNGSDNQQWEYIADTQQLKRKNSDQCLSFSTSNVQNNPIPNGTNINTFACLRKGHPSIGRQRFVIDGKFIKPVIFNTNRVLDIHGGNKTNVILWQKHGGVNQQWVR